jgi:hypothetical protein
MAEGADGRIKESENEGMWITAPGDYFWERVNCIHLCEGDAEELRARHVGEVGVAALPGGEVGDGDGLQLRAEAGHVLLRHLPSTISEKQKGMSSVDIPTLKSYGLGRACGSASDAATWVTVFDVNLCINQASLTHHVVADVVLLHKLGALAAITSRRIISNQEVDRDTEQDLLT